MMPLESIASCQECKYCPLWLLGRPRAVVAYGAVRTVRGTLRQHVGGNAHEDGVFCSCTPAMAKPPQQAFSPHMSRDYTAQQHSQPVNTDSCRRAAWTFPPHRLGRGGTHGRE